jgi:hypothetical protein
MPVVMAVRVVEGREHEVPSLLEWQVRGQPTARRHVTAVDTPTGVRQSELMKASVLTSIGACALAGVLLAGCGAQPDGPAPKAEGEVPNRLSDITKDIESVAGGDRGAPKDLSDDLGAFASTVKAQEVITQFTTKTSQGLVGKKLSEANAQKIANEMWLTVAAVDYSRNQVKKLQEEMKSTLISVGVADKQAEDATDEIPNVQKLVTNRPRRWYEFF